MVEAVEGEEPVLLPDRVRLPNDEEISEESPPVPLRFTMLDGDSTLKNPPTPALWRDVAAPGDDRGGRPMSGRHMKPAPEL